MQRRGRKFTVTLDLPPRADLEDARMYIQDAVETWCGQLFPGDEERDPDPMWGLDASSVHTRVDK